MTEPSTAPETTPDVAEIVSFLRRFADLMSNGYNAGYLHRASDLLETMTARVIAAADEEDLWRYKYDTLTQHADALETECESLKNDIEGHLDITSSVMAERDVLGGTLQAREAELSVLREELNREREQRAAKVTAHEQALESLRVAFDQKREALQASLQARGEECERLRRDLEREREDGAAKLAAREAELSELRLAFERERAGLQAELKARGDELAAFRMGSEREQNALRENIAALEAKRNELRSAFDRINDLRNQTLASGNGAQGRMPLTPGFPLTPGPEAAVNPLSAPPANALIAAGETNAVVPKTTLRQVRAQFEYLAKEFIPLGDIASRVMCELGAYTMDMALVSGQPKDDLPVGEMAQRILADAGQR